MIVIRTVENTQVSLHRHQGLRQICWPAPQRHHCGCQRLCRVATTKVTCARSAAPLWASVGLPLSSSEPRPELPNPEEAAWSDDDCRAASDVAPSIPGCSSFTGGAEASAVLLAGPVCLARSKMASAARHMSSSVCCCRYIVCAGVIQASVFGPAEVQHESPHRDPMIWPSCLSGRNFKEDIQICFLICL